LKLASEAGESREIWMMWMEEVSVGMQWQMMKSETDGSLDTLSVKKEAKLLASEVAN